MTAGTEDGYSVGTYLLTSEPCVPSLFRRARMSFNVIIAAIIAGMIGIAGFAFWYQRQYPREIVAQGSIEVVGVRGTGPVRLKTRDVSINKVIFKEVEMPNGTWIDCAGDCVKAAREAGDGFWPAQINNKR